MTKEEKNARQRERRFSKKQSALFKECTDQIIAKFEKNGYHIENLIRSGGYFIFDFGGNSVNTFWLKEIPGWRFGIWWTLDQESEHKNITIEFFTQFERDVDKFKPSRSEFLNSGKFYLDKSGWKFKTQSYDIFDDFYAWNIAPMLNFIKLHPYRAWARSSSSDSDKYSIPWSGFKCWIRYHKHIRHLNKEEKFRKWADAKLISWFEKNVKKFYKGWRIHERKNMSPKYQMYVPLAENRKIFSKRGFYGVFYTKKELEELKGKNIPEAVEDLVKESPRLEREYEKLKNKLFKIADRKNVYYFPGIDDCILVLNKKGYEYFNNNKVDL